VDRMQATGNTGGGEWGGVAEPSSALRTCFSLQLRCTISNLGDGRIAHRLWPQGWAPTERESTMDCASGGERGRELNHPVHCAGVPISN